MTDYLIRSSLCLVLLLAVYHLIFESKKLHEFKRFFLLFSLAAGLFIPLVTIEVSSVGFPFPPPLSGTAFTHRLPEPIQSTAIDQVASPKPFDIRLLALIAYGLGSCVFLLRFADNIFKIGQRVVRCPRISLANASVVLLPEDILPHSFLSYIFVNEKDYMAQKVEDQLILHELTHVQEKHSLDILFVEALRIVFWFNPVFLLYKRAIQLNHEFLADQAVVRSYDIADYQTLLLGKSVFNETGLASNLNYSLTKKRLQMMTKTTSRKTAWAIKASVVPLALIMFVLFSNMTETFSTVPVSVKTRIKAQSNAAETKLGIPNQPGWKNPPPAVSPGKFHASASPASQQVLDEYTTLVKKYETIDKNYNVSYSSRPISAPDKSRMEILYSQMNGDQQRKQRIGFSLNQMNPFPLITPSSELFLSWKDASLYGVWINEKYVKNSELNKYKPSDFSYYHKSNLHYTEKMRQNVMKRFNLTVMYKFQLTLMTNDYFEEFNKKLAAKESASTMWYAHTTADGRALRAL